MGCGEIIEEISKRRKSEICEAPYSNTPKWESSGFWAQ